MRYTDFKELKIKYDENNVIKYKEKNRLKVKDKRTKLNDDGIYEVYPIAIYKRQLYVICPHCNQIHIHGNAKGTYPGYRNPVCVDYEGHNIRSMYYVKEVIEHV